MNSTMAVEEIARGCPDHPGLASLLVFKTADLGLDREEWQRAVIAGAHNAGRLLDRDEVERIIGQYYDGRIERRGPWEDAAKHIREQMGERVRPVPLTFRTISNGTKSLMPGKINVLYGNPGSGKSLWLLQNAIQWSDLRIPYALIELEDDTEYHMQRALAMRVGRSCFCDPDWLADHAQEADEALSTYAEWGRKFGESLYCPTEIPTYSNLLEWIEGQVIAGKRVIAVDPITNADHGTVSVWDADKRFIRDVSQIIAKRAALFVVHHPADAKGYNVQKLSGGKAWQRFTHGIFYIESLGKTESHAVLADGRSDLYEVNRVLTVEKCRGGRAEGWRLGYLWDFDQFRFTEQGIMVDGDDK